MSGPDILEIIERRWTQVLLRPAAPRRWFSNTHSVHAAVPRIRGSTLPRSSRRPRWSERALAHSALWCCSHPCRQARNTRDNVSIVLVFFGECAPEEGLEEEFLPMQEDDPVARFIAASTAEHVPVDATPLPRPSVALRHVAAILLGADGRVSTSSKSSTA
jgi:hypothetical protein